MIRERNLVARLGFLIVPFAIFGYIRFWRLAPQPTPLNVAFAQRGDLLLAVTATGTIQSRRTVDIKYDTQSLVTGLGIKEGDRVVAGQVVATMDLSLLTPALAQARQTLEKDQATLTLAEASLRRAKALAEAKVLAQADLDSALASEKSLSHQTQADRESMVLAQEQIARAKLRTPISGVVVALYVHQGEMLGSATAVAGIGPNAAVSKPTNTLMTIAEEGALELDADVNAVDIGGVYPRQEGKFTVDAFQGKILSATVYSIALQPTVTNGVTTYRVLMALPHSEVNLRIGMPSNIMLFRTLAKEAILAPPTSVFENGRGTFVQIIRGLKEKHTRTVERVPVQIVAQTSSAMAITGQVEAGDALLLAGQQDISNAFLATTTLISTAFQPNPDLSDLQFERKNPENTQNLGVIPGPKPKGFLQKLFNP